MTLPAISTGSGKSAKANIDALRQRRIPVLVDKTDETIEAMEALADKCYTLINSMRNHINAVRPLAIAAKQLAMKARKARKIDLEL